jgi:hypothetical protein
VSYLVKIADDTWVNPSQVAAMVETYYPSSESWQVVVYLKHSQRGLVLTGSRAEAVAQLLTGEYR